MRRAVFMLAKAGFYRFSYASGICVSLAIRKFSPFKNRDPRQIKLFIKPLLVNLFFLKHEPKVFRIVSYLPSNYVSTFSRPVLHVQDHDISAPVLVSFAQVTAI